MSAARTAPPAKQRAEGPLGQRIASEASDRALHLVSLFKEMVQDFRNRDRFFKYKASIVAGWFFLSAASLGIACPGSSIETAGLGARVTVLPNAERPTANPSLTVNNTGDEPWVDVLFVVNSKYRATIERVEPGGIITLTPKNLMSSDGAMPADTLIQEAKMRTASGEAELVRDGQPL